jgi:hypothetical protein
MATQTTTHLTTSRRERLRHFLRKYDPWLLLVLTLVGLPILGRGVRSLVDSFQGAERSIIIVATPALPLPPTATPSPPIVTPAYQVAMSAPNHTGACAVIGYSAPSLDAQLGAIEPQRPYTPTERIGDEWLQAQVAGSGLIWLRPIELACLAAVPDIATPVPPAVPPAPVVMLAAPARVEPLALPTVVVPTSPPVSPPSPTAAMQLLTAPEPTPWDSEAARQAEREAERQAWESVDDAPPAMEGAP